MQEIKTKIIYLILIRTTI